MLYLLQLVQALKFEKISPEAREDATQDSSLARFLISRATLNINLGNYFHWYLMVECDDSSTPQAKANQKLFGRVAYDFQVELLQVRPDLEDAENLLMVYHRVHRVQRSVAFYYDKASSLQS